MANVILQVEELTKSYGDRMLFADVTFGIEEGDKIGIVARNGTGKTTLMRIIAGVDGADSGRVIPRRDLRIGFLEQVPPLDPDATVTEACDAAVDDSVKEEDGEAYEDRRRQMLTQLGITDHSERVAHLSGGQRKRVALAAVLLSRPDLLILDEPTNHLDIAVIEWLEKYLARQRLTLLMVTHDRYFLDRVCSRIIEMDHCRVFIHRGNFDYYLRRRAEQHRTAHRIGDPVAA